MGDEFTQLERHIVAGGAFTSNFLLWHEAGYFDPRAELKPLLHLWSLGIEEQFYPRLAADRLRLLEAEAEHPLGDADDHRGVVSR